MGPIQNRYLTNSFISSRAKQAKPSRNHQMSTLLAKKSAKEQVEQNLELQNALKSNLNAIFEKPVASSAAELNVPGSSGSAGQSSRKHSDVSNDEVSAEVLRAKAPQSKSE